MENFTRVFYTTLNSTNIVNKPKRYFDNSDLETIGREMHYFSNSFAVFAI